jgi:hypothetical protein
MAQVSGFQQVSPRTMSVLEIILLAKFLCFEFFVFIFFIILLVDNYPEFLFKRTRVQPTVTSPEHPVNFEFYFNKYFYLISWLLLFFCMGFEADSQALNPITDGDISIL